MARTKRRRKQRGERGEELRTAGNVEHLGGGRYRIRSMRGDKVHRTVWRQAKLDRACTCSDLCMFPYSGHPDHCEHVHAAIADRDAALAAVEIARERARVMQDRGDVHVRDGRDFTLFGSDPYILVEDLRKSHSLPLDLSRCTYYSGETGGSVDCEEFIETGGTCAHALAARMELLLARGVVIAEQEALF